MSKDNLLRIYKDVLRPSAEYSSIVYNSLIPEYIPDSLESVQKQALKIILGRNINYRKLVDVGTIETLKSRRESAMFKFTIKAANSGRFGKN